MAGEFVLLMLDMSKIDIPDDSSRDGVAPSMWGSYCGEEKPNIGRFVCTFCFRIIEAKFPRYDKILNELRRRAVNERITAVADKCTALYNSDGLKNVFPVIQLLPSN